MVLARVVAALIISIFVSIAYAEPVSLPASKPWLRADSGLSHMRRNRDLTYIAYVPVGTTGVRVIDTKTGSTFEATSAPTGGSFFWAPDNVRLFYRELALVQGKPKSVIKAWDSVLKKSVHVDNFDGSSGMLTFDPRDHRMMLMHDKGIMTKRLVFPDERLAHWQSAQRTDKGKWVAAAGGMTFISQQGFAMEKMLDDGSGVESFDISPKGDMVAWSTKSGKVFASRQGEGAKFIDYGRDPQWHPEKELLVFSGGRMVGNKASSFDVKVAHFEGPSSFLTTTQARDERWPLWTPKGDAILYTVAGTTDVMSLNLVNSTEPKKL